MSDAATEKALLKSRDRVRAQHFEQLSGELNLVPYLDVMINLIMFILLTMTTMLNFGIINLSAPAYATGASTGDSDDTKAELNLLVTITDKGFLITGAPTLLGHPVAAKLHLGSSDGGPTIAKKKDDYDYEALAKAAKEIKLAFPAETKAILFAEPDIWYEVVVKTMDAIREEDGKVLFPDVVFNATLN
jgi:biopolymer transport protein ExbD